MLKKLNLVSTILLTGALAVPGGAWAYSPGKARCQHFPTEWESNMYSGRLFRPCGWSFRSNKGYD